MSEPSTSHRRLRMVTGHMGGVSHSRAPHSDMVTNGVAGEAKQRAVIVLGTRTPFCKSFGKLAEVDSIGLGCAAIKGLLDKTKLNPENVDEIIYGTVVVQTAAPNIAREIVLDLKLPKHITGTTVSIACLSGMQAVASAVSLIEAGGADCIIAGGSDSTSNGELPMPRHFTLALGKYNMGGGNKNGWKGAMELMSGMGMPNSWVPTQPSVAERSTGKTMGYHADVMAEINKVPRQAQDELAMKSHLNAARAKKEGILDQEIVPVTTKKGVVVKDDDNIRAKQDPKKMAELKPCFRPPADPKKKDYGGTITAASSSPLTDGASAVLVMSETRAKQLGYPTDISVRAYVKCSIDPHPQLLLAPALAIPACLAKAGLTLDQMDILEVHEAFAAQVLATIKCIESPEFTKSHLLPFRAGKAPGGQNGWPDLGLKEGDAVGKVDFSKLNPNGGSIAIGHPFAATGGRLIASAANQLRATKKRFALLSVCAAGGIGGVMILERQDA